MEYKGCIASPPIQSFWPWEEIQEVLRIAINSVVDYVVSTGAISQFGLKCLEPVQCSMQGGILLGEAEAHHTLIEPIAVKG